MRVVYGSSHRTTELHRGQFAILRAKNQVAFEAAALSCDTKFDMRKTIDLPYTTTWFSVPPVAPHGQRPVLGTLHSTLVRAAAAAIRAAESRIVRAVAG